MQYVKFGKTGIEVSRLGFGAMRLPQKEVNGVKEFDTEEGIRIIHKAMAEGVNYFDTAPYYCEKQSEIIVGKALKGRRSEVYLSTKNPIENASGDDFEKRLETSLTKLDTDYIDFYHMWGIDLESYETKVSAPDGPLERAIKLKAQGVIRHISFSFHDDPKNMIEIIKRGQGAFESVLCQYNLLDRSNEESIAFAHEQGLGVVIMGPVGGGRLGAPSEVIRALMQGKVESSAEVALRFVMSNPNVHIALSGMSSMAQVEENCRVASNMQPLSQEEQSRIETMMAENKRLAELYCTGCNYCMPCPAGLNIPEIFKMMNYHRVYKLTDFARQEYARIGKVEWMKYENASACAECGECEGKCPQHLKIRDQLKQTHEVLG
jgi:predicted aldo/keto reductase-like oxidoreductase